MYVHWVNVIILAQFHNPSILNPDFLAKKIVPRTWEIVEAITTPAAAQVVYGNGIRFVADQSRLEVRQDVNGPARDTYEIFDLASKYVQKLPHVPYKSMGLNWQLSLECKFAIMWLLQRFYRASVYHDSDPPVVGCGVQLHYDAQSAVCNLKMDPGNVHGSEAIVISANFHHGVNTPGRINAAITRWPDKQAFLEGILAKLLRAQRL